MNMQYMEAFAEIDIICQLMPKDLLVQIPLSFRTLISSNKSTNYPVNIKPNIPLEEQELKKETKSILSLIYRNYMISPAQKEKLELEDSIELEKLEKEMSEKYNIDNIFKKKKEKMLLDDAITQLPIDYSNLKWYQKLYNKFLNSLKK